MTPSRSRVLRPTREEAVAAFVSALLFAVAFPPFPFVSPAFLCLVPVAVAVARQADEGERWTAAARTGFWFGVLGYGANLYWIAIALSLFTKLALLGYVASLAWLGPWVAIWAVTLHAARRITRAPLVLLLPLTWVAHEVVLTYLSDLSFPWLPLGLAVAERPVLAQLADLSGVHGLSLWIAASGGLLADAWLLRLRRPAVLLRMAGVVALAALVAAYGAWRMRTTVLRPLAPIAVVQPNVPEDVKLREENKRRFIGIMAGATREALAAADPALVVWPETALPGFIVDHPDWVDSVRALVAIERAPILFGTIDLEWVDAFSTPPKYNYYNAALLADSLGRIDAQPPYRKKYLVPIVERVPFLNPQWFSGIDYFGGFGRGGEPPPFELPFGGVGTLICYESIYPQHARAFRRQGADLLANITNDAWFGHSSAPWQHFAHMRLRAIETRMAAVRSANTGISAYIDPLGRVHGATGLFVPAVQTWNVETSDVVTPFVRFGDWIGWLCLVGTAIVCAMQALRSRRLQREGRAPVTREPLGDEEG